MNKYIQQIKTLANNTKYTKWYCIIIESAVKRNWSKESIKTCDTYAEKHHILPKSFNLGGDRDKDNLVFLTAKEHFIIHLLATKMFTGLFATKMNFAFYQMRASNKHQTSRYINSRFYDTCKNQKSPYTRLYKLDKVVYVNSSDTNTIVEKLSDGWSKDMTPEFKIGRVGNMRGKKHSESTKRKISRSNKGRKIWIEGSNHSDDTKKKISTTKKQRFQDIPELKQRHIDRMKREHELGIRCSKGAHNPMFGKKRQAIHNPITLERRYIDITNDDTEVQVLLSQGWILGFKRRDH